MGDEFQLGSGSWWDSSSRNRFESGTTPATSSISTTLNAIASFGWPTEMVDMKSRSSMDSAAASTVLQGGHDDQLSAGGGVLANPNLQVMGLGLSSQSMDWNQALLSEKGEGSFRSLLQEDLTSNGGDFPPESGGAASAAYGLLLQENQHHNNYQNRPISNYPYEMTPSMNKYPPFLRTSPPKQAAEAGGSHLHFTNNTPFWNASAPPAAMSDARSSFFPPLQTQISTTPSLDTKPKNIKADVRELSGVTKKGSTETSNKRQRNETPSPLPAFKVRKEKMGDRITALQQLVSPFGKTDTASVLSEAIEYIKFLHEQVSALSAPYMKNGAAMQNQPNLDKSNDPEGPRQDLRTRGLCLVPVSSTFPVTHETAVDFWTPTFGGTFR